MRPGSYRIVPGQRRFSIDRGRPPEAPFDHHFGHVLVTKHWDVVSGLVHGRCFGPNVVTMRTTRLRVTMSEVEPKVVRVIDVPAGVLLPELHDLLQVGIG